MRVLVIPEDPLLDQYVLKPVIERIFVDLGEPKARVEILQNPRLRGVDQALDPAIIRGVIDDYEHRVDLFLLVVDADCDRTGNTARCAAREAEHPGKLLACLAVQEVEAWMLAIHRDALGRPWGEVRSDCDVKEHVALPFLEQRGWDGEVGGGRKKAMRGLGSAWSRVVTVCEELRRLRERIRARLAARA